MPGTMIGHYEVIGRIGSGGFATVYRARDVHSGETAALKGVIHRDIKPQNTKITPTGVVKVLDFGIARATEGTNLTQTGAALLALPIGTPQYMAPEVWEGKPADCRTDVYALGLVLSVFLRGPAPPAPGHLSVLLSAALALAHRGQLRRVWCLAVLSEPQFPLPYPLRSGRAAMGKTEVNG